MISILLVEDNPADARLVELALSQVSDTEYSVTHVERLGQATERLAAQDFDAVLLDLSLPDSHGLDTVREIQAADRAVPVVVLSGTLDDELALEAVKRGAQDYLVKGQGDGYLVSRAIRYSIERRRGEEALRESEQMLAAAQRIAHVGNWFWEIPTGRLSWSDEVYRIFGLTPQEFPVTYPGFLERVHPNDRSRVEDAIQATVEERRPHAIDFRIRRPDGTERIVQASGEAELGPAGDPLRVIGAVQDITERRRAEDQVRRARDELERRVDKRTAHLEQANLRLQQEVAQRQRVEEVLRRERDFSSAVLDTVGALVVVLDPEGQIVRFNRTCERMTGMSAEDVKGLYVWDLFVPEEDVEGVKKVFDELAFGHFPNTHENSWIVRGGEARRIAWSNTVLLNERGSVDYVIATGIDVTEQRLSENALRESERQLRLITDTLPVLIAYVDASRRFRFSNKAFEEWFGYSPQEINGRHERDVVGAKAYEVILPYIERALAGERQEFEANVPYERGGARYVGASYIPDLGADGAARGYFALVTDITERKESEHKSRQRMLELAHASRLSTMGEMTTEIAHELNQPLTAIASFSDTCRRLMDAPEWDEGDVREALGEISRQALRAGKVIKRLRSFARKETSRQALLNLNDLVLDLASLTDVEARWHGVQVVLELAEKLPPVHGDQVLLEQVILNLIRNAIETMASEEAEERRLEISTRATERGTVQVAVRDSGPPSDANALKKAFEPFYTTKSTGVGMGLVISQSIIQAHGGQLWAHPNAGHGATFAFALPVVEAEEEVREA
ncbi:MAG: PAS domain S-box protein [Gammaproteobacteria bacterium]|nr:PAS domain S-box protein [Gammaproteobacteria bacterium]NIR97884.1 PAS domain S-box protein [Gammaproteobacteria bacterium]NIT63589.1 PAS domain S-box protein [Gammaproteobacteria bacterium]NIV20525.1 PAS domain S-box protein [Gammaproteobacteria bacterium]NIX11119.1 PAS domain S-box protein [Gammaproteobacteria bacterium]